MKNLVAIACMAALSLFSSLTFAEHTAYIGIAAGTTLTSIDEIGEGNTIGSVDSFNEATASKIFVGFKPAEYIIIEASLFTTGEGDAGIVVTPGAPAIPGTPAVAARISNITIETSGLNVAVLYVLPDTYLGMTAAFGGGIFLFETEVQDFSLAGIGNSTVDTFGASLHGRMEYILVKTVAFRLDLDVFMGVEALGQNKMVSALTAGIAYTF